MNFKLCMLDEIYYLICVVFFFCVFVKCFEHAICICSKPHKSRAGKQQFFIYLAHTVKKIMHFITRGFIAATAAEKNRAPLKTD